MDIRKYQVRDKGSWDALVQESNNGTLFHSRQFLNYHPLERFVDHSLIFSKKNHDFTVFPAAEMDGPGRRMLVSHPGASMGSFAVPADLSFADANLLVESVLGYAREDGFDGVQLTLPPAIYQKRFSNYIDFVLIHSGFEYQKREVSSVLFLESSIAETLAKFKPAHRTAVRKAEKSGVRVERSNNLPAFYNILEQNLSIRHGVQPTHTLEELDRLAQIFPDRINLFAAFLEKQMIAGVVNFCVSDSVVLAFYISHDESFQKYRPINLLFYHIFDWAISKGYKVFDFGIFTVNEEPNLGLARFKENFGASGIFRDTLAIRL